MLAVICRIVLATGALTCGQPLHEDFARSVAALSMKDESMPGLGKPFVVLETDSRWTSIVNL